LNCQPLLQAPKVFSVDNPFQVKGAFQRAFSNQEDPPDLKGDSMHGMKRISDAAAPLLSGLMKGIPTTITVAVMLLMINA
jgi:hypothetical protein